MHILANGLTDSWSLGTLIGLPIAGFFVLLAVIALAVGIYLFCDDMPEGIATIFGALGALVLIVGITAFAYFPFDSDYHKWKVTTGDVQTVDKRMLATDGGGMEEKFVVTFKGDSMEYGVADTRAASLKKGDHLTLKCKRAFQFTGTDGYDCVWGSKDGAK